MFQRLRMLVILISAFTIYSPLFAFKFTSTYTPPDTQPVDYTGKKIVVLVLGKNLAKCLAAEKALAGEITARGAIGIAGRTLIPENEITDKDKVKAQLEKAGVAGAVVIRAWVRGRPAAGPDTNRSFWTFYGEPWDSSEPAPNVDLYVETRVYNITQDALMWTGSCGTKASKLEKFIQELVPAVAEAMGKQGLLKKQP